MNACTSLPQIIFFVNIFPNFSLKNGTDLIGQVCNSFVDEGSFIMVIVEKLRPNFEGNHEKKMLNERSFDDPRKKVFCLILSKVVTDILLLFTRNDGWRW